MDMIVGILENAPDSATSYILESTNVSGLGLSNFNYMEDEFYIRNSGNANTYLEYDLRMFQQLIDV